MEKMKRAFESLHRGNVRSNDFRSGEAFDRYRGSAWPSHAPKSRPYRSLAQPADQHR